MASFLKRFFQGEFVIDEKPVPLVERSGEDQETEQEDLLGSLSQLLKDHETLSDLAEELQERGETESEEMEPFMRKMLPFLDSFERILFLARSHPAPDDIAKWLKSVESVYYRVTQLLESYGLVAMQTVGHTVNLDLHEVVEVVDAPDRPSGAIIAERKKGYIYRGRLMRCASVVVAKENK